MAETKKAAPQAAPEFVVAKATASIGGSFKDRNGRRRLISKGEHFPADADVVLAYPDSFVTVQEYVNVWKDRPESRG